MDTYGYHPDYDCSRHECSPSINRQLHQLAKRPQSPTKRSVTVIGHLLGRRQAAAVDWNGETGQRADRPRVPSGGRGKICRQLASHITSLHLHLRRSVPSVPYLRRNTTTVFPFGSRTSVGLSIDRWSNSNAASFAHWGLLIGLADQGPPDHDEMWII